MRPVVSALFALAVLASSSAALAAPYRLRVHVPEPAPPVTFGALPVLLGPAEDGTWRDTATIEAGGRRVALTLPADGGPFLSAQADGRELWVMQDPPAAGGSDVQIIGRADRRIVFMTQSRIGTWALDTLTGATLQGYDAVTLAPDGTWALMFPYVSGFTGCAVKARPIRLPLDRALAPRELRATSLPATYLCSAREPIDPWEVRLLGGIAPDGATYVLALQRVTTGRDAGPTTVEVYARNGDRRLAKLTLDTPAVLALGFAGPRIVLQHDDDHPATQLELQRGR